MSLATLHEVIQIVNSWDNDYLHRFHIYAVNYGISYRDGLSFRDNAYKVLLDNFEFDIGDRFFYEYNFFENHRVDIRVERVEHNQNQGLNIICTQGNGMPGITKHDITNIKYDLIKAIAHSNHKDFIKDIAPYVELLQDAYFRRKVINHRLKELTVNL